MIKVILIDDHPVVRSGLKNILREAKDIDILGEAGNYADAFILLSQKKPDIVLSDVQLPGRDGLQILKDIRTLYPHIKVLFLSMQSESHFGTRAIKEGAHGFLSKGCSDEELLYAIRQVHNGRKYISSVVAEQMANAFSNKNGGPAHESLSNRELEILCLIASGKPVSKIAPELSLSPATVATYRARILKKLQLKSNVELAAYALRNNLVN